MFVFSTAVGAVGVPVNAGLARGALPSNVFQSVEVKYPFAEVVAGGIAITGALAVPVFVIGAVTPTEATAPHLQFDGAIETIHPVIASHLIAVAARPCQMSHGTPTRCAIETSRTYGHHGSQARHEPGPTDAHEFYNRVPWEPVGAGNSSSLVTASRLISECQLAGARIWSCFASRIASPV